MYLLYSNLTNALGLTRFASDLRQMGTSEGGMHTCEQYPSKRRTGGSVPCGRVQRIGRYTRQSRHTSSSGM